MAIYSIKDLEKLSGIKAHTIRIWEQRYDLICPCRTKSNIRYYDDTDLRHLLNIALLNKNGIKISKIAEMTRDDIAQKVAAISEINYDAADTQLDALTLATIEMDEVKFGRVLSASIQQVGFENTMTTVVYPFLERLNILYFMGTVCPIQGHFISHLLRQKLIAAIDREPLTQNNRDTKKFILFLPETERQELSLLFLQFLLKKRKHHIVYLGQDINIEDLQTAYNIIKPDFVFTLINENPPKMTMQQYLDALSTHLPDTQILLSGYQAISQPLQVPHNVALLQSLDETIQYVEGLKKAR